MQRWEIVERDIEGFPIGGHFNINTIMSIGHDGVFKVKIAGEEVVRVDPDGSAKISSDFGALEAVRAMYLFFTMQMTESHKEVVMPIKNMRDIKIKGN